MRKSLILKISFRVGSFERIAARMAPSSISPKESCIICTHFSSSDNFCCENSSRAFLYKIRSSMSCDSHERSTRSQSRRISMKFHSWFSMSRSGPISCGRSGIGPNGPDLWAWMNPEQCRLKTRNLTGPSPNT